MTKRLFLLNGLAILAVVCSHTTGWGSIAMSPWADRYRLVVGPNYDQTGTLPYYMLLAMKCLMPFSFRKPSTSSQRERMVSTCFIRK